MTQEEMFWKKLDGYTSQIISRISGLSMRSFIGITNLETKKTWWSDRAVEFFGLSGNESDYGSEKPKYKIHPDDLEYYRNSFGDRMNGKNMEEPIEYRLDVGEGEYRTFSARCDMVRKENGQPVAMVVLIDDNGNANIKIGFKEPRSDGESNAKIASIIEYGKQGQPPKPFLKPAKSSSKKACVKAMVETLEQEVKNL